MNKSQSLDKLLAELEAKIKDIQSFDLDLAMPSYRAALDIQKRCQSLLENLKSEIEITPPQSVEWHGFKDAKDKINSLSDSIAESVKLSDALPMYHEMSALIFEFQKRMEQIENEIEKT